MLPANNPQVACVDEIEKDGEKEQCAVNITSAKLLCEWLDIFVGREKKKKKKKKVRSF